MKVEVAGYHEHRMYQDILKTIIFTFLLPSTTSLEAPRGQTQILNASLTYQKEL